MYVIIVVGIILAAAGIGFGLYRYNKYLETEFGDSMFNYWKTLLLLVTEIIATSLIGWAYTHYDIQFKSKIILISIAVAFFLLVLVLNIHTFGIPHGVAVTMLQLLFAIIVLVFIIWSLIEDGEQVFAFAFFVVIVLLIIILVLAAKGGESRGKTDTQSNTVTTTQNTLVDEFNENALITQETVLCVRCGV